MSFTAATVMKRASTTLEDVDAIRWPATELCDYLNDAVEKIAAMKPNACTITTTVDLAVGTKQTLPDQYTILASVIANDTETSKRAVSAIAQRSLLDRMIPNWQDSSVLPFSEIVSHVIHDIKDPRTFYVAPGNDGNGKLEVIVGIVPAPISYPANALSVDAYTASVPLPDIYKNAVVDYVLYRCFSKDSGDLNAGVRAKAHLDLFNTAIGEIAASEAALSLATAAAAPG